jgi:dTDP-4-amino-4,6-dideoxygalactose transaminase
MSDPIPFNRPSTIGNEFAYIREAIQQGWIGGNGSFGKRCEGILEGLLDVPRVLLVTSGTHALEMAALLLDLSPGDEVAVPAFAHPSTANAFAMRGARPVFVDIRPDTLNLDEQRLESALTPRTRAIVPVHYAGVACAMEEICGIAERRGIEVVEDNALGLLGRCRGRCLGTQGRFAALSFHETKSLICGEGGALLVRDPRDAGRAEILREKGTDRERFFRGEVDRYTWQDLGSSYVLSDLLAAFLCAQLEAREEIVARRRAIWTRYFERLSGWAGENGVGLPVVPEGCEPSYTMFHLLLPSRPAREGLIARLRERGIHAVSHYQPLHRSAMARRLSAADADCPVTDRVSDGLLRLPFYTGLSEGDQERVIRAVAEARVDGS